MRASSPAWRRSACSITSGAEAHTPRQILRPLASTTQIAVVFCDTSKPTKWVIDQPPMVETTGPQRPDHGTIGQSARTAITRCPHLLLVRGYQRAAGDPRTHAGDARHHRQPA